jgi:alcohol dehydrogenase
MRALQLQSPREFAFVDRPHAAPPAPGEALVRVHRIGICGTDISAYLGKMPFVTYPRILGHELGVEVLAVGDGVTNVKPGDRCSVEPYLNDPTSYASRRGRPNCCERLQVLGVHIDGGMRPEFVLPARKLHVSARLSFEQLALVETLAIGCHAVARSGLTAGETCLIVGAGPIGLATLEFVRLAGCSPMVLDLNRDRLDFCRRVMDVAHTLQPSDHLDSQLRDLCDGHLPDVVIDATGNSQSMGSAFGLVAPGGRLVFVGIPTEDVHFRHPVFHRPEGTLLCSRNALPADFARIISLIEQGRLGTEPRITHRTALDELPIAFGSYLRPETGVVKAMVEVP